jgi:hypothetical protein
LPPGLTLDPSSGVITGTPTTIVSKTTLTFKVTDASNPTQTSTSTLTFSTAPGVLQISTPSLPNGQLGVAYSATVAATGGTVPYTWSLASGTLPTGLSLNSATGAVTGTPTALGRVYPAFKATDAGSPAQTSTTTLSFNIAPATLGITTTSLPNGQVGVAYSATLAASGGTTPYAWSLAGGTLPAGLSLNVATGAITGTPTTAVSGAALTFKVSDSSYPVQSVTAALTLTTTTNTPPLSITTTSLPNGQVGVAYSATLTASGGTTPYTWSLTSGTLPAGLSLNTATGAITGTPTTAVSGTSLSFKVTDSGNPAQNATVALTLTIASSTLTITTTSLPNGQVGVAYSTTLIATGGTKPYTWSLTSGTLPAGLSLNTATGAITGTPTAAVSGAALAFQVSDSSNPAQNATVTLTLTIASSTLTITTTSLPNGQVGVAYSKTLTATGGTKPYTWSLTSGTLPAGLSLNAATGAITGTPTAAVSSAPLTFTVTDSSSPAQSAAASMTLTIAASPLTITTTSLPNGQVGVAYSTTLTATGGTKPYTWSLTSGTLPAGLSLNASTGAIAGTPTAAVSSAPLTFMVTDSSTPSQSSTASLTLTVGANGTMAISPRAAGLTVNQTLSVSATTNDPAGVTWTLTPGGGSVNPTTSLSGVPVTVTAPGTAGVYTLTATSVTDSTRTISIRVGVTDLTGVLTWHNDVARDGVNPREFALTTANVNTTSFGKLFSLPVDGAVYSQPLWVANLTVAGARHNVLYVATQHDGLYAFDADNGAQLWKVSLFDSSHGGNVGETAVPWDQVGGTDIVPEVGVNGTPVIDAAAGVLYVVSKSIDSTYTTFYQRLHAIDLATGKEKGGSPLLLAPTYPGTAEGGTTLTFNPHLQNQRAALALINGTIYVSWGSHADVRPYYGWVAGYTYNGSAFSQTAVFNTAPDAGNSGIWMSGAGPAADSAGNIYVITGDGTFDVNSSTPPNKDYADSLMRVTPGLAPLSYFTPSDQATRKVNDMDFGAGGPLVLTLPSGSPQHLVVAAGKVATLYLVDGDNLRGFGDTNALQYFTALPNYGTGAFWNNTLYLAGGGYQNPLEAFAFNTTTNLLTTVPTSQSSTTTNFPGASPSISATGSSNGLVWLLNNVQYCTPQSPGCAPSVLYAFDAANLANELWNSSRAGADTAGNAVKFTVATVANGKVYVGTRGNNTGGAVGSTSIPGEVDVYGLKP